MSSITQLENGLTPSVLRDTQQIVGIAREWGQLYERCVFITPFQRPEWVLAWIEAFQPRDLIFIQIRDEERRLIGLAPLLIYSRGPNRILAFAGGGVSDYLGLIAEAGEEQDVLDSVLQCTHEIPGWNLLELTDLHHESPILLSDELRPYLHEHDACSVLRLPASEEELRKIFSDRQRANLRNAASRLKRAGAGQVELARADTLPEFLDDLIRLHTARWSNSGEAGVLNDERTRSFHRLCSPGLLAAGILKLHRLRLGETTIAVLHSLWHRETVYCYLQGFDPEHSFLSPGTYLIHEVLRDAIRCGMRNFDFLRGQEHYKRHWRAQAESTYRVQWRCNELDAVPA